MRKKGQFKVDNPQFPVQVLVLHFITKATGLGYPRRGRATRLSSTQMKFSLFTVLILLSFATSRASAQLIQQQEMSSWCWAACIQDIEAQSGIQESQSNIVSRLYGRPTNKAATVAQVSAVLQQVNIHGAYFTRPPMNPLEIVNAFSSSRKIIALVDPSLGAVGHFVVLEAADPNGNVLVSDPFPPFTQWMPVAVVYQQYHWIASVLIR